MQDTWAPLYRSGDVLLATAKAPVGVGSAVVLRNTSAFALSAAGALQRQAAAGLRSRGREQSNLTNALALVAAFRADATGGSHSRRRSAWARRLLCCCAA